MSGQGPEGFAPQFEGAEAGQDYEKSLLKDFGEFRENTPYGVDKGESVGLYKIKTKFLSGEKYVKFLGGEHYSGTLNRYEYSGLTPDIHIHSHPGSNYPSLGIDTKAPMNFPDMKFYLYGQNTRLYQYNSTSYWRILFF